ncbi:hypothetical protein Taro_049535 [Colocasia esculenta]|uniref:LOB domain-containing protein n=1 Tax=Colocasia esculenta TaxID=4460 RepID=A0A843XBA3_COLES|nr:hypothetical protein [Colocasia esculenta]
MDGSGGGGGGSVAAHACAACKHQRRKCGPGCPMARYFPASRPQEFRDAHRLFGLSNLTRVHNSLPPGDKRDVAMKTMIFEAGMWRADPVRGAYGVVRHLLQRIEAVQEELKAVRAQLAFYRWPPEIPPRPHPCPSSVVYDPQALVQPDYDVVKPSISTMVSLKVRTELPPSSMSSSSCTDEDQDSKDRVAKNLAHLYLPPAGGLTSESTSSKLE